VGSASDQPDEAPPPNLGASGAAMREEWRAEQESATRDAAEQWRHSRTLLDLAREHMHRGDRVAITVAGHRAVGVIIEVANDRIALLDDTAPDHSLRTDVHVVDAIPLAFSVVERARAGGRTGARTASFRARLLELEAAGAPVTLATAIGPDAYVGTLSVGTDLVVIATSAGVEMVVALPAVASVSPVV
jgi:hypothetical protein